MSNKEKLFSTVSVLCGIAMLATLILLDSLEHPTMFLIWMFYFAWRASREEDIQAEATRLIIKRLDGLDKNSHV